MIKHYTPIKDPTTNLELSVQEVNFLVTYLHFNNSQGRLKVRYEIKFVCFNFDNFHCMQIHFNRKTKIFVK